MAERIRLSSDALKCMSLFTAFTKVPAQDCIDSSGRIIFIVPENCAGKAIGKGGMNIKRLEEKFKKRVRVIEFNSDPLRFIRNAVYPNKVKDITEKDGIYTITPVDSFTRGQLIGRGAVNLREYELIIKRYFGIQELKVI